MKNETKPKPKKITRMAANALAQRVHDKLEEVTNEVQSRYYQDCVKSAEYKELKAMGSQFKSLEKRQRIKADSLRSKYPDLVISTYSDGGVSVRKTCRIKNFDNKRVSSAIVTANHIDNVPIEELVNHIVKLELARKEPKCS